MGTHVDWRRIQAVFRSETVIAFEFFVGGVGECEMTSGSILTDGSSIDFSRRDD